MGEGLRVSLSIYFYLFIAVLYLVGTQTRAKERQFYFSVINPSLIDDSDLLQMFS